MAKVPGWVLRVLNWLDKPANGFKLITALLMGISSGVFCSGLTIIVKTNYNPLLGSSLIAFGALMFILVPVQQALIEQQQKELERLHKKIRPAWERDSQ